MSESKIKYKDAKTCMFLDVEDYPIPDIGDPCWMKDKIEKAFKSEGFSGELSIQAYVDKNTFTTELERKYLDADIKLFPLCEGRKEAKVSAMLVDVLFWAFENPAPANLVVLSKAVGEEAPYSVLKGRDSHVLCDLDSCESIPKNPFEMQEKIKYLIEDEGYFGRVTYWMVANEKTFPADLVDIYVDAGLLILKEGDKDLMVHEMLTDILFWALRSRQPGQDRTKTLDKTSSPLFVKAWKTKVSMLP